MAEKKKYYLDFEAIENKTTGTHSFYSRAVSKGTIGLYEMFEDAGIEPFEGMRVVDRLKREILKNLRRGLRCEIDEFMTFVPSFKLSVKDHYENGELVVATPEQMDPEKGESYIGIELNKKFQWRFQFELFWRRIKRAVKKKK